MPRPDASSIQALALAHDACVSDQGRRWEITAAGVEAALRLYLVARRRWPTESVWFSGRQVVIVRGEYPCPSNPRS